MAINQNNRNNKQFLYTKDTIKRFRIYLRQNYRLPETQKKNQSLGQQFARKQSNRTQCFKLQQPTYLSTEKSNDNSKKLRMCVFRMLNKKLIQDKYS